VILAIETSCDETCAAVCDAHTVHASIVSSQIADHNRYGGVVPEIASRRHLERVVPIVREALAAANTSLDALSAVAVTAGPGLVGALLVGVAAAKAYAYAADLPLIAVDHLHGHVASLFLEPEPLEPPFLCLLVSGGHTLLLDVADHRRLRVIGRTLDDACGEAFDKGARLLGLGYPGGRALETLAADGDRHRYPFPIAMRGRAGLDFSFSGLKTALAVRAATSDRHDATVRADLAASYQHALIASLVHRTTRALDATGATRLGVVGGVAANRGLREALARLGDERGVTVRAAAAAYCSDNAAMIAAAAHHTPPLSRRGLLHLDAYARSPLA
jgi:N6-L-threonylcarbamoyladenine synthase